MKVLCAIPGLIWPAAGLAGALAGVRLPGLSYLLAHATQQMSGACALNAWLAQAFGIAAQPPYAALRLAAAGDMRIDEAPDRIWLCADPVSLRFARDHLLLQGPDGVQASGQELQALFAALNASFADIGEFFVGRDAQGYFALAPSHADKLDVELAPLADVEGRPIAFFQPTGTHAAWWSRLANELQVFCHNHPVNRTREAEGATPINGLWLWGAGRRPTRLQAPAAEVAGSYPLLRGLARLAGAAVVAFDPGRPANWNLIDTLHAPAQARDLARWVEALRILEADVLEPLAARVRRREVSQLQIIAPGDASLTRFDVQPAPGWQFWKSRARGDIITALDGNIHS